METILLYASIFIKIIIIFTLIFILFKMNYHSVEKFYDENENTATSNYKITCGNTDDLVDTTCKIYKDNINILKNSIGDPIEKNKITLEMYNYKQDALINIPIIERAIDKLKSIKIQLEENIELQKIYIYIILIILIFNNNKKEYNLLVKILPLILNLKKIKGSYTISNALNDVISLFNNENQKYTIPQTYSLSDLTNIKTSLKSDIDKSFEDIKIQKDEYNDIIKDILIIPRFNYGPVNQINEFNLIIKETYNIYNKYKNANLNYKIAAIDEAKNLSNFITQVNVIHTSFLNYLKALIGISETIDPSYLNVIYIKH